MTATPLSQAILRRVSETVHGIRPHQLIADATAIGGVPRREVRRLLTDLVDCGALGYVDVHGQSHVVIGRHQPLLVSDRFALVPEQAQWAGEHQRRLSIRLAEGASFGDGAHPTTRLALAGLACIAPSLSATFRTLDVGTGTGVLIIGAVRYLGGTGVGIDIDPVAVAEARYNVAINALSDRIDISASPVDTLQNRFDLILANLRPPTLAGLARQLWQRLAAGGRLLLTGGRPDEMQDVAADYARRDCEIQWRGEDKQWAAVMLRSVRK